jgi:hypothetical protein
MVLRRRTYHEPTGKMDKPLFPVAYNTLRDKEKMIENPSSSVIPPTSNNGTSSRNYEIDIGLIAEQSPYLDQS